MAFSGTKRQAYIKNFLMLALAVFFTLTYVLYRCRPNHTSIKVLVILVYVDVALLFLLSFFVWQQIRAVIAFRQAKSEGHKLYRQIIYLFSGIAVIPSLCVFIFSMLFFNIGIENLFKNPIKNATASSEEVIKIYLNEVTNTLENFVTKLGKQVESCIDEFLIDSQSINSLLAGMTNSSKIDVSVIQILDNNLVKTIAETQFAIPEAYEQFTESIASLDKDDMLTLEFNNFIFTALVVNRDLGICIVASLPIDLDILEHRQKIMRANAEYSNLSLFRTNIKISFMMLFSILSVFLLLVAILTGIVFAKRTVRPINKLVIAVDNLNLDSVIDTLRIETPNNELRILVNTFNAMIDRIMQQNKQIITVNRLNAWQDIARKMAHEIKNPLTPIQLSAERIRNKYQKEIISNPEVFNNCIETIIRQVKSIGNLVTEFSNFARMPKPKIERVDIVALIKQSVLIQSNAHKNIRFIQHYGLAEYLCYIDPSQINQVILNLIQNAVNSITENNAKTNTFIGCIMVTFGVNDETIFISIEDDGIGFSDLAMETAFEPYFTTRENGTGLGLAIVNKIVLDHGGKIILGISQELGGAKVLLKIPCEYMKITGESDGI